MWIELLDLHFLLYLRSGGHFWVKRKTSLWSMVGASQYRFISFPVFSSSLFPSFLFARFCSCLPSVHHTSMFCAVLERKLLGRSSLGSPIAPTQWAPLRKEITMMHKMVSLLTRTVTSGWAQGSYSAPRKGALTVAGTRDLTEKRTLGGTGYKKK